MHLSEIIGEITVYEKTIPSLEIDRVTANKDLITENTLFVLFCGIKFDTTKIIKDIILKKPIAIITDVEIEESFSIPILHVKNARQAYSQLMWNFCKIDAMKSKFYAVTGTNGKTTTATMLFNVFRSANITCGFIGTGKILINETKISDEYYSMTTPDPELLYPTIKRMQDCGCQKIVMEVSSHALSLFKVSPISFECSLFTNLSDEHLDFHKNKDDYFEAKLSLFSQSKRGIFNLDDEYAKKAYLLFEKSIDAYGVAIKNDADAIAKDIWFNGFKSTTYIYREKSVIFKIVLSSVGEYNISNSLLAIKCALLENVSPAIIQKSFDLKKSIDDRFETVCKEPMVIIDYAHTCAAMESILNFIKSTKKPTQRIITVFGCGGERDRSKRPKMAMISEKYSDFSIITSDNSRAERTVDIITEILLGFSNSAKYKVIEDRESAISYSIQQATKNDIVVIIGKGHERYTIDADGYHNFDERDIIRKVVRELKSDLK